MTTVGYGDIAPKSIRARIFSVAWILAGIIVFNILSGELTTVIIEANTVQPRYMTGERVGVLKSRVYDEILVAKNGGEVIHVDDILGDDNEREEEDEFKQLIGALRQDQLDGILVDKYTYWDMVDILNSTKWNEIDYVLDQTMTTEVPQSGEKLSYGILVKSEKQYQLFKPVVESNKMLFQKAVVLHVNKIRRLLGEQGGDSIFHEVFMKNIVALCVSIVAIGCFGFIVEVHRRRNSLPEMRNTFRQRFLRTNQEEEAEMT